MFEVFAVLYLFKFILELDKIKITNIERRQIDNNHNNFDIIQFHSNDKKRNWDFAEIKEYRSWQYWLNKC